MSVEIHIAVATPIHQTFTYLHEEPSGQEYGC